ncbi:MAG: hypothetical protein IPI52_16100 [Bacteroidetes bacterium]|nr:hypothetical protein [Bacteroidota bacterium]
MSGIITVVKQENVFGFFLKKSPYFIVDSAPLVLKDDPNINVHKCGA